MKPTPTLATRVVLTAALVLVLGIAPLGIARADDGDDEAAARAEREKLAEQIMKEVDEKIAALGDELREEILAAIERRLAGSAAPRAKPAPVSPRAAEKELWFADGWADWGTEGWRAQLATLERALAGFKGYSSMPGKPTLEALAQLERRLERYERALLQGYWTESDGSRSLVEAADRPLWFQGKWAQWGEGSWRDYFDDIEIGLGAITSGGFTHSPTEVRRAKEIFAALRVRFQRYERALLEGKTDGELVEVPLPHPTEPPPAEPRRARPDGRPAPVEPPEAKVRGAFLGVQLGSLDEADPRWRGKVAHGLLIVEVLPDTPAARARLREGDVITEIGGQALDDLEQFIDWIGQHAPGDRVSMKVFREEWEREISVTLGKR